MHEEWERELAKFLQEVTTIQGRLLDLLQRKQRVLAAADTDGLTALALEEGTIEEELKECLARRAKLLEKAASQGLPADRITNLAGAVGASRQLKRQLAEAAHQARLVQIHNLTNWMLNQRALIHLSQLIEIIATGGRRHPTYHYDTNQSLPETQGVLVDHNA